MRGEGVGVGDAISNGQSDSFRLAGNFEQRTVAYRCENSSPAATKHLHLPLLLKNAVRHAEVEPARGENKEAMPPGLTVGVEEEFFVVDPTTRALVSDGQPILDIIDQRSLPDGHRRYDLEFYESMIESRTAPCRNLAEVRAELQLLRTTLIHSAAGTGRWVMAAGTPPVVDLRQQRITPKPRYVIVRAQKQLARELLICGCHIHVGIYDKEMAVQV